MLDTQGRLEAEIEDLCKYRDGYQAEMSAYRALLIDLATRINTPTNDEQPDVAVFGRDAWVYCRQHMRAHETGWCGVSPRDKVGLGVKTADEAIAKCREWGFELYQG